MKRLINSLLAALLAMSYGAAFAQNPTPQDSNTAAADGKSAANAETKTESSKTSKMGTGPAKMDADGDGTVTKAEWDAYHSAMWDKLNQGGKVSSADAEAMTKGGTN